MKSISNTDKNIAKIEQEATAVYYLNDNAFARFEACSMRKFDEGECHITRVFKSSVLILMLGGILRFTEDGNDVSLRRGEYYIQRSGLYQEGRVKSDVPEYFYIHFDGRFANEGTVPVRGTFEAVDSLQLFKRLEDEYFSAVKNPFALTGLFYDILGSLNQPESDKRDGETAAEIEKFIMENFASPSFSLDDIKKKFNFSTEYLIKIFSTRFLMTPHKYVTGLRIKRAKQLMLSSERSIGLIASECGYEDYSVFYKNFKNETGMSPDAWRRKK